MEEILSHYPSNYKCSAIIPLLMLAQKQNGNFLTLSAMNKVAKIVDSEPVQVYEVASFYTMFNRTRVGKFHLQVCGTTPCMVRGARDIMQAVKDYAHIGMDETSADGLFTLQEVECLGACTNAPMIQVNNEWFYEDLTPESMTEILKKFEKGEHVEPGPQTHRRFAEGPQGRTCLEGDLDPIYVHHSRDFAAEKAKW